MKNLITLLLLFCAFGMNAQIFNYGHEGLTPLEVEIEIPDTRQGRVSEGIISFIQGRFAEPRETLKDYRKFQEKEEFLLNYPTGVRYLDMGVFEAFGNLDITINLTSYDSKYKLSIKSVIFEKGSSKHSALQKNAVFYSSNAKARFDQSNQGERKEVDLDRYFDLLINEITNYINRENRKDR